MNLVLAALEQTQKVPGIDATTNSKIKAVQSSTTSADGSNPCNNPTFKPGDSTSHNQLVDSAPFPDGCDAACQAPWTGADAGDGPTIGGHGEDPKGGDKGDKGAKGDKGGDPDSPGTPGGDGSSGPDGATDGPGSGPGGTSTPVCDPDTGICSTPDGVATGDGTTTAGGELAPTATSSLLSGDEGWAGRQTLIVVSLILLLALLAGAPAASVLLGRRGSRPGRSAGGRSGAAPGDRR
jgi:hypothetical protein